MKALGSHPIVFSQTKSDGKGINPAQKSATARETINALGGFGSKPPSSANKEDNKATSGRCQDGKRPAKNPKPRFHIAMSK